MKTILLIALVVVIAGLLLFYVVKEFIKTYKNEPESKEIVDELEDKDRL
ncbi:MAG: hypothetical protein LBM25_08120 [Bacteroidales bacterium]|jgi:hypothetical protein|nr:hypothetical protein [Bacteroidales bacterium]